MTLNIDLILCELRLGSKTPVTGNSVLEGGWGVAPNLSGYLNIFVTLCFDPHPHPGPRIVTVGRCQRWAGSD